MSSKTIKRLGPVLFFLIVTYVIFAPSSLFLENINEFSMQYFLIIPSLILIMLAFLGVVYFFAVCIFNKGLTYYIAILFGLTLGIYFQENFLNPKLPALDGTPIDWSLYVNEGRRSVMVWGICIATPLFFSLWKKEKTERIIKWASLFLGAVQLVSLLVLIFTSKLDDSANYGFSKEGEFTVGKEENIVLFVVDTLQSATLEEYIETEDTATEILKNFTFFDNAVSGGAPTALAMPVLLTGNEYDPMQSEDEYYKEIWEETNLYNDLREAGYDVRFFSDLESVRGIPETVAENYAVTGRNYVCDYVEFTKQLYKLVNFYVLPQPLKQRFWMSTDEIMKEINKSEKGYQIDDVQYYQDFIEAGSLETNYAKTFRLYHLNGVHAPYNMNEEAESEEEDITEQQQLKGVMKIINEYMGQMKELGIYDTSTIIILGDHGRHESGNLEANPAVLIKRAEEEHELEKNSAPIHFRNIVATMAEAAKEDYSSYGPSVYDIDINSDVERLHTINASVRRRLVLDDSVKESWYYRFIVTDDAGENLYQIRDPYNINCIDYHFGDIIDFRLNNDYAQKINYRLYKENGAATASNELSICFVLDENRKEDIQFCFQYSSVYNREQNVRIYANGKKIETVKCTDEEAGVEKKVSIDADIIEDNKLIIRMVFPNAVTPKQINRDDADKRVLSMTFETMSLK